MPELVEGPSKNADDPHVSTQCARPIQCCASSGSSGPTSRPPIAPTPACPASGRLRPHHRLHSFVCSAGIRAEVTPSQFLRTQGVPGPPKFAEDFSVAAVTAAPSERDLFTLLGFAGRLPARCSPGTRGGACRLRSRSSYLPPALLRRVRRQSLATARAPEERTLQVGTNATAPIG